MLTDDELIQSCHAEIQRLRGVIRELEEKKRYLLIKTDGQEIGIFSFDSIEDASKEMEKQYQENDPKDAFPEVKRCSKLVPGEWARLHSNYQTILLWKIVEVPMN